MLPIAERQGFEPGADNEAVTNNGLQIKWLPYPYDSRYEVSDYGQIRNVKTGHISRGQYTPKGYKVFKFGRDGKWKPVHLMVLETFEGPCPEGYECDHINSVRDDNRLCNLRYVTPKENSNQQHRLDLIRRKVTCYDMNHVIVAEYVSATEAANSVGTSIASISKACNRGKPHKDHYWRYTC